MSDQTTAFLPAQLFAEIPANTPPEVLLSWLRSRRRAHFTARPLPPCFRLKIGHNIHTGQPSGATLPMSGWAILADNGEGITEVVALGLEEDDAKERAAALNTATAPTGLHSRN